MQHCSIWHVTPPCHFHVELHRKQSMFSLRTARDAEPGRLWLFAGSGTKLWVGTFCSRIFGWSLCVVSSPRPCIMPAKTKRSNDTVVLNLDLVRPLSHPRCLCDELSNRKSYSCWLEQEVVPGNMAFCQLRSVGFTGECLEENYSISTLYSVK